MLQLEVTGPRTPGIRRGLKDGGETVLKCSNCDRGLACVRVIRPDAKMPDGKPLTWLVRATCAYGCLKSDGTPEMSYVETIVGAYVHGGYGIDNPDDPDDSDMKTGVADIQYDENPEGQMIVTFITKQKEVRQ